MTTPRSRLLLLLTSVVLLVAACSPPEDVITDDLVITGPNTAEALDDYAAIRTTTDGGLTWTEEWYYADENDGEEKTGDGLVTDLCTGATCVRLQGDHAVQESLDGGATWDTVWAVDDDEGWVSGTYGRDGYYRIIRPADIAAFDNGVVLVSMGDFDPLRRDLDGNWSMTTRSFRQLHPASLFQGAIIGLPLVAALSLALGIGRGSRLFRPAVQTVVFAIMPLVAISRRLFVDGAGTLFGEIIFVLLGMISAIAMAVAAFTLVARTLGYGRRVLIAGLAGVGLASILAVVLYQLWKSDMFSAPVLGVLWIVAVLVGAGVGALLMRGRDAAAPMGEPLALVDPPAAPTA